METVLAYYSDNIETVSKEELLEALRGALESSRCWREACLLGISDVQKSQFGAVPGCPARGLMNAGE